MRLAVGVPALADVGNDPGDAADITFAGISMSIRGLSKNAPLVLL